MSSSGFCWCFWFIPVEVSTLCLILASSSSKLSIFPGRDCFIDSPPCCLPLCNISIMFIDCEGGCWKSRLPPMMPPVLAAGEIGAKYASESPGIWTLVSPISFRRFLMIWWWSSCKDERRLSCFSGLSCLNQRLKRDFVLSPSPPTPFWKPKLLRITAKTLTKIYRVEN